MDDFVFDLQEKHVYNQPCQQWGPEPPGQNTQPVDRYWEGNVFVVLEGMKNFREGRKEWRKEGRKEGSARERERKVKEVEGEEGRRKRKKEGKKDKKERRKERKRKRKKKIFIALFACWVLF